jgi:gliding motility-associated-like protein
MKRKLLLVLMLLLCIKIYAQKEASTWTFGNSAKVSFSSGIPELLSASATSSIEGCSTISDASGDLLFYTNGEKVWNKVNGVMPNGDDLLGHPSTSQSAIIIPKPNSTNLYYIFTLTNVGGEDGLRYSEVNMLLSNGFGDVTGVKNVLLSTPLTERMTVARHSNGIDYWIIVHNLDSKFLAFKVSASGVSTDPVISSTGANYSNSLFGCMKVSPNGEYLAVSKPGSSNPGNNAIQIFNFNMTTGEVNNPISVFSLFLPGEVAGPYGIEFSPNSKFVYVGDLSLDDNTSKVHQFNIENYTVADIINSHVELYSGADIIGSIQLAINGRIYLANSSSTFLDEIQNPNVAGVAANYVNKGVNISPRSSLFGLPQFATQTPEIDINVSNFCFGDETAFSLEFGLIVDSVEWTFGDGNISNSETPTHIYTESGIYDITANVVSGSFCKTILKTITIANLPNVDNLPDLELCDDESNDGIEIFNLETQSNLLLSGVEGNFNVSYHLSEIEAEAGDNALNFTYENSVNNEEVFVRIEVVNGEDCYAVGSFLLKVINFGTFEDNSTIVTINVQDWAAFNNTITINVEGNSMYEYSIDGINFHENSSFTSLEAGAYTVYIKDFSKCSIFQREVALLDYPRFFTPNGDGVHDLWKIKFSELEPDMKILIFNRYGKLITSLKPRDYGWDGTLKGNALPQSDYWFIVKRPSRGLEHTGHFTLKR